MSSIDELGKSLLAQQRQARGRIEDIYEKERKRYMIAKGAGFAIGLANNLLQQRANDFMNNETNMMNRVNHQQRLLEANDTISKWSEASSYEGGPTKWLADQKMTMMAEELGRTPLAGALNTSEYQKYLEEESQQWAKDNFNNFKNAYDSALRLGDMESFDQALMAEQDAPLNVAQLLGKGIRGMFAKENEQTIRQSNGTRARNRIEQVGQNFDMFNAAFDAGYNVDEATKLNKAFEEKRVNLKAPKIVGTEPILVQTPAGSEVQIGNKITLEDAFGNQFTERTDESFLRPIVLSSVAKSEGQKFLGNDITKEFNEVTYLYKGTQYTNRVPTNFDADNLQLTTPTEKDGEIKTDPNTGLKYREITLIPNAIGPDGIPYPLPQHYWTTTTKYMDPGSAAQAAQAVSETDRNNAERALNDIYNYNITISSSLGKGGRSNLPQSLDPFFELTEDGGNRNHFVTSVAAITKNKMGDFIGYAQQSGVDVEDYAALFNEDSVAMNQLVAVSLASEVANSTDSSGRRAFNQGYNFGSSNRSLQSLDLLASYIALEGTPSAVSISADTFNMLLKSINVNEVADLIGSNNQAQQQLHSILDRIGGLNKFNLEPERTDDIGQNVVDFTPIMNQAFGEGDVAAYLSSVFSASYITWRQAVDPAQYVKVKESPQDRLQRQLKSPTYSWGGI